MSKGKKVEVNGWEDQSIFLHNPQGIDIEDEDTVFFLTSFGGCAWPVLYIIPTDKYSMTEPFWQALQDLYTTKEGQSYQVHVKDDKFFYKDGDELDWLDYEAFERGEDIGLSFSEEGFMIYREDVEYISEINRSEINFNPEG